MSDRVLRRIAIPESRAEFEKAQRGERFSTTILDPGAEVQEWPPYVNVESLRARGAIETPEGQEPAEAPSLPDMSDRVRELIDEHELDPWAITPTGARGDILVRDVEAHLEALEAAGEGDDFDDEDFDDDLDIDEEVDD